jgi:hypothetical protein
MLTYCPNNLLLNSATLSTQSVAVAPIDYILSFKGTGTITKSGTATGALAGTGASDRVFEKFTPTAGSLTLTVSGSVTEAQLEAVTYQTTPRAYVATTGSAYYGPRFDYNPATLAARGLLIEEARTNLILQSNNPSSGSWSKSNLTNVTNKTTGPDGVSTSGTLLNEDTVNNVHGISQSISKAASAITYTLSCFAKIGVGRTRITLSAYANSEGGNGTYAPFDLSGGQAGTLSNRGAGWAGSTSSITSIGNGWYRCTLTVTTSTGTDIVAAVFNDSGSGTATESISYAGTVGNGCNAYGAQLEPGSFATSYIPTAAASVTRAADSASMTGTNFSSWYNQSEGTLVVNGAGVFKSGAINVLAGTDETLIAIGSASWRAVDFNSGFLAQAGTQTDGATAKIGFAYQNGASASSVALNGAAPVSFTRPGTTATTLYIGTAANGGAGQSNSQMWIASLTYYNARLPNATLQTLTT